MANDLKLGIIIPCFNEQEVIVSSIRKVTALLQSCIAAGTIAPDSFIGLVDDRSTDGTWEIIKQESTQNKNILGIRLSANRGHQNALFAGLMEFNKHADCIISLDADLQDDIYVIPEMIEKFRQGSEIVYGVRNKRNSDTGFKRVSAKGFYRLMSMFGTKLVKDHADFRLTSHRVLDELKNFGEVNLFLRGMFPLMGFNTSVVYYERGQRTAGESKYPLRKMISLALDGITSYSIVPLRIITVLGFMVFFICVALMIYAVLSYLTHKTIAGWFSTVLPFYFLGGIQILCLGIIGEYMGKIYKEVKRRPRYIIDESTEHH